jgi:Flp pilus assembly protein TadB
MGDIESLKEVISRERRICMELGSLEKYMNGAESGEKNMIGSQIAIIRESLRKTNDEIPLIVGRINLLKPLNPEEKEEEKREEDSKMEMPKVEKGDVPQKNPDFSKTSELMEKGYSLKDLKPTRLEKLTLKRMKEREKKSEVQKEKKPSNYIKMANKIFSDVSDKLVSERTFQDLERDLIKANLQFTPRSYISVIFLTTCIAFAAGILIGLFFFFFKISPALPIILKATGKLSTRFLISMLIVIFSPVITFLIMYSYPGLEKSSTETRIEEELPFATIHMSAISGSMIDPSKIFNIIISTHEYPFLEKEFTKLINGINLYGYDLVSALRNSSYNSPSKKLSELFNGLATTINSGGYLPEFFDKRSQTLLFENRLEQEKKTKAAETFMDIYISLVVAAPMILMILLMMMKISGLGVSMSTSMITIVMVIAVTMINIVFLTFLQLKK